MDSDGAQRHLRPTKLRPCTVGEVKPQLTLSANGTTPSTLLYTTADNVWRNGTAQAWGTHTDCGQQREQCS
jgi:hypothetical protein